MTGTESRECSTGREAQEGREDERLCAASLPACQAGKAGGRGGGIEACIPVVLRVPLVNTMMIDRSRLQDAERTRLKDTTAEARALQEEILKLRAALHDAEHSVVQVSEDLRKAQGAGEEMKNKCLDQFDELQQECTRILVESHGRLLSCSDGGAK